MCVCTARTHTHTEEVFVSWAGWHNEALNSSRGLLGSAGPKLGHGPFNLESAPAALFQASPRPRPHPAQPCPALTLAQPSPLTGLAHQILYVFVGGHGTVG